MILTNPAMSILTPDILSITGLKEVATRYDMTGGQIRNAAFPVTLLALDEVLAARYRQN